MSDLGRIFDVSKPWLNRVIERAAAPAAGRGGRRDLLDRPARDLRAGRRVRLGQVDRRQDGGRADRADHRRGDDRRRVDEQSGARRRPRAACAAASRWCSRIPTPASIRAGARSTSWPSRSAPSASAQCEPQIVARGRRAAEAGRPRSGRRRKISARVLRRPAPAHRDRARARLASRNSSCATSRPRRSTSRCRRRSSI